MSEPVRTVYIERPRSHGCLWGCLGVALIVALPLILAWGYGFWFVGHGLRDSPMMRTAIAMAERDPLARMVLGSPIEATGMEGNSFSFATGVGARNAYVILLKGAKASGTLAVTSHTEGSEAKIDSLMLTGPDGRHYDLLHHGMVPGGDAQAI